MKKLLSLTLVSFLALPAFVFAASGACSGHGGVNCSAGSDSDGSVICMDGWRNSSVSYASMVKCGGGSTAPKPAVVRPKPTPIAVPQKSKTEIPIVRSKPTSVPAPVVEKKEPVRTVPTVKAVETVKETQKPVETKKVEKTETPRAQVIDAPVNTEKTRVADFVRVWNFFRMIF